MTGRSILSKLNKGKGNIQLNVNLRKLLVLLSLTIILFVNLCRGVNAQQSSSAGSKFAQTITPGVLVTEIRDANRITLINPTIAFANETFSFDCLGPANPSEGVFGTNLQRIYVDNPYAVTAWHLNISAVKTTVWTDGGTPENRFDFNDPGDAGFLGCSDLVTAGDTDAFAGQMKVDPFTNTIINPDCTGCNLTGISKGSSASFVENTTDAILLMKADNTSQRAWRGYLTNIELDQTIPANQAATSYSIQMSVDVIQD